MIQMKEVNNTAWFATAILFAAESLRLLSIYSSNFSTQAR